MDFETVIKTRRSIRSYSDKDVPEEVLERVLYIARMAPSAVNNQPWQFIVIRNKNTRQKIAALANDQDFVADAPVVVVFCGKRYDNPHDWIGHNLYLIDVAIAIDHFTLAARNEGLGTCWIGAFDHQPLKDLLAVPTGHDVVMLVPVGYPESDTAFHLTDDRRALADIVYRERFG